MKLLVDEAGSDEVLAWATEAAAVACSPLAYPEVVSAFSRKFREGSVAPDLYAHVLEELQRQWDDVVSVAVDERLAGSLAKRYPLSGADAVHLAAATTLAQAELPVALCSYDQRLNAAAVSEGLRVLGGKTP